MRQKIKGTILFLNIVLAVGTILAYVSPHIHPEQNRIPGILGLFFPVLFFLNLLAILFWMSFGRWFALVSVVCLLAGFQPIRKFFQPGIHKKIETSESLRIATYNVFSFNKVSQSESVVYETFRQIVRELGNPDIICLQEAAYIGRKDNTVKDYPHLYHVPGSGTTVLSKYPIIRSGQITFDQIPSLSCWLDVKVRQDTIRIFGLHLMSNRITEESEQLIGEKRFRDSRAWKMAGGLIRKYSRASAMRANQADVIRMQLQSSPYPVLLVGDFNDTPQSYAYSHIVGKDIQDSFVERGAGIGTTYGGSIPGLRIDYVLADGHFTFTDHEVLKLPYSDHYAVVSECLLRS